MNRVNPAVLLIVLSLVVVSALVGFSLGKRNQPLVSTPLEEIGKNLIKTSPVLETQTATAYGKITASDGKTITLENKNGVKEVFPLMTGVAIAKYEGRSKDASISGDLSAIELNQEAMVVLNAVEGEYKVASISYLPPVATPPPTGGSATSSGRSR